MNELKVISIDQAERWNQIVEQFERCDVYYSWEYAYSFFLHGDGEPELIFYEKNHSKICYVMMKRDIADSIFFENFLEKGYLYDWTTPYGYGGPLFEGELTNIWKNEFKKAILAYAQEHHIVSQFFRFHPLLHNQTIMEGISDVLLLKKTVYIDTTSKDIIFQNMTPNSRNMIRKAEKYGIEIFCDKGEHIEDFRKIYEETMKNNSADNYYYFADDYFHWLIEKMKQNVIFFYAKYQEKIISASIFFYNNCYMHYHLSGTLPEYNKFGAANLLLNEAANWAAERGIKQLHLGGGVGIDDSLLRFKKHFNRNGLIDFCIGRNVFSPKEYDKLIELRAQNDDSFDKERPFMIKYRG